MKQPLIILSLISLAFLSGCTTVTPRTVWFKLPSWKKQEKTELANKEESEKEKGDSQRNKFNPFKRNKKRDDDKSDNTQLASAKKEKSKIDKLIDAELVDATETERAQMKRDLKGRDITMARSIVNIWKNVRRVQNNSFDQNKIKQASSEFPITPVDKSFNPRKGKQQRESQLLQASQEKPKREISNSGDFQNRTGLGTNPWGDSPFEKTNHRKTSSFPARSSYDQRDMGQGHRANNQQQPASQIMAGHSTDLPHKSRNPFGKEPQNKLSHVQPVEHSEERSARMERFFNIPGSNHQDSTQATESEQGADARVRHLENLIALTENELVTMKQNPGTTLSAEEQQRQYVERQVYLRMLYLMAGEQVRSFDTIPGIPAADQEFWRQLFWGMANYFDHTAMPDARTRATQTVAQLQQATLRLQANANLQLRNLNFCHKISSFGNYETFKHSEFRPGQRVLLYSEVQNFKSNMSEDGKFYRTMLKSTITIHRVGNTGGTVAEFQFDPAEDLCRNYRKDYFHSYEIALPDNITLGPHVLTLTVTDQLGDKIATETLKFNVK